MLDRTPHAHTLTRADNLEHALTPTHAHALIHTPHTYTPHTHTPHARSRTLAGPPGFPQLPACPPSAASEPGAGEPELPLLTSQRRDSLTAEAPASRPPGSAARGALAQGWVALGGVWPPHALAFAPGRLAELKGTGAVLSASWKGDGGRGHPRQPPLPRSGRSAGRGDWRGLPR